MVDKLLKLLFHHEDREHKRELIFAIVQQTPRYTISELVKKDIPTLETILANLKLQKGGKKKG
ncbi:MAG: hypothetical protein C6I00_01050 [Nitratiruptor sp.]|nr:hypothetical protein [Nitratiruptor sp.]NPA83184.1 hypothetical protein [Campylobacterota bacterium]